MSESTMTPQRALSFLKAFAPCPHTSLSAGFGSMYVKCLNCGVSILHTQLHRARTNAEEFEAATDAIARLINAGPGANVALVMRAFCAWRSTPETGTPATDGATARAFGEMLAEAFVADAKEQGK